MITLIGGNVQGGAGNPIVPLGSIELYLNADAQVIASPYGHVLGGTTNAVQFYFDDTANLIQPAEIWSNAELNPQNSNGFGTWYVVNFYDKNGGRLNNSPMTWVFPNAPGTSVDISTMIEVGAGHIYYPSGLPIEVQIATGVAGNFTVAHGLDVTPSSINILMTSPGVIWAQYPIGWDSTNLYLAASNAGLTALIYLFI